MEVLKEYMSNSSINVQNSINTIIYYVKFLFKYSQLCK